MVDELAESVAVTILDAGYEKGFDCHTSGREGVVGCDHIERHLVSGTHAQRLHFLDMSVYAHLVHHFSHSFRPELLHQIGGDVVGTLSQAPFQVHGQAYPLVLVGASRSPGVVADDEGLGHIHNLSARGETVLHREGIEEWLDCGTHLPAALTAVVVFEPAVIGPSHIGFDVPGERFYGHECSTEETFVVAYGIVRRHQSIHITLAVPSEYAHFCLFPESLADFVLRCPFLFHTSVPVAPPAGLAHQTVNGFLVHLAIERSLAVTPLLAVEGLLEVLAKMLCHSLFRISLHIGVDGGIDAETVAVKVIFGPVSLAVLFEPSVQTVIFPPQ